MKLSRVFVLFIFSAALPFHAAAQFQVANETAETGYGPVEFYLLPLIEATFSGNLPWRPNWPANIPPDAFSLSNGEKIPLNITLSNNITSLNFTRNNDGRLSSFPFFLPDRYLKVEASFSESGALQNMNITCQAIWNIEFPAGFFPFSEISPGGAFPMITVNRDDSTFFVFIFESPAFLTETWYDYQGNLIGFARAAITRENRERNIWRIRSMQIRDALGIHEEEIFHDSAGNISEIRSRAGVFSAFFRGSRPVFWQPQEGLHYDLQWDGRGLLVRKSITRETPGQPHEYRYIYELDNLGNWTSRSVIEMIDVFGLLVPRPSYEENFWAREINKFP